MASIYKRGKVWYIYYRVDGKRIRRRVGTSKKVAQLALSDVVVKLEKKQLGFVPPPKKQSKPIKDFLAEYENYSETNHRPATVVRYAAIMDNFEDFLDDHPEVITLSDLSGKLFEEYKTHRRRTPTTANGHKKGEARKGVVPGEVQQLALPHAGVEQREEDGSLADQQTSPGSALVLQRSWCSRGRSSRVH